MAPSRGTFIRRRIAVFGAAGVFLAGATYLPLTLLDPLEQLEPARVVVVAPENPAVELDWPASGSAAIGAVGFDGILAHGPDTQLHSIASITKIITSLVVLQERPLAVDDSGPTITMTQEDVNGYYRQIANNGSTVPVRAGLQLSQRQLMEAVLVASANNYAETLARWAFGSQDKFLSAARSWLDAHGLTATVLFDASGIDPRNVSTAAEIVELGKLALREPVIADITSTESVSLPYIGVIENTNELLGWNGVDGIKTGTVSWDEVCLLFATTVTVGEEEIDLVGVVLDSSSHEALYASVRKLLTSAVLGFREVNLVEEGDRFAGYSTDWDDTANAVASTSASVIVWAGTPVTRSVTLEKFSTAREGEKVGEVTFATEVGIVTVPLILDDPLEDPGAWWRLTHPFD